MTNAALKVEVPGVDFAGLAREAIAAKLTEAFTNTPEIIQKVVATALAMKVDSEGKPSNYSYSTPYIEWMAQQAIREAVTKVMREKAESLEPVIRQMVEKELSKSLKAAAKLMTDGFIKQCGERRLNIEVGMKIEGGY